MGAIHEGHLSLIKKSNTLCNKTIVTIFINKPQFNKKNDFKKYPRRIKKDISILKKAKINFIEKRCRLFTKLRSYNQIFSEPLKLF